MIRSSHFQDSSPNNLSRKLNHYTNYWREYKVLNGIAHVRSCFKTSRGILPPYRYCKPSSSLHPIPLFSSVQLGAQFNAHVWRGEETTSSMLHQPNSAISRRALSNYWEFSTRINILSPKTPPQLLELWNHSLHRLPHQTSVIEVQARW